MYALSKIGTPWGWKKKELVFPSDIKNFFADIAALIKGIRLIWMDKSCR